MKTAATIEAPEAGTGSATPELFAHDWDINGECTNPERLVLDGMPADHAAVFRLGMAPDRSWRVMGYFELAGVAAGRQFLGLNDRPHDTRAKALLAGLDAAAEFFKKDKRALKVIAGFRAKLEAEQAKESSPTNKADESLVPTPEPAEVSVSAIEANPLNERERPKEYIDELAASIAREGLLQRIGVVLLPPGGEGELKGVPPAPRYRLVYGGCRLKAVRQLKHKTIRAEVYPLTLTPRQEWRLIKVENLKRRNPNPVEEAQGYADHMREFNLTQDAMAKEIGKSRPVVANALRLLELPEPVREILSAGALTLAHGTALCRFKDWPAVCTKIAELAVKRQTAASVLEKNLPFGEDLVAAKLAVELFETWDIKDSIRKKYSGNPGFFIWHDKEEYNDYGYCLDLELGKAIVAEEEKKAQERREKERQRYAPESNQRDESGELTPAAKRERERKINANQTNRLSTDALAHAALVRLAAVKDFDAQAIAIVAGEVFRHCSDDYEEIAAAIGVKLPKNFDHYEGEAGGQLKPIDAIRLAAAAIVKREHAQDMRFAGATSEQIITLVDKKDSDGGKLVEGWKRLIKPMVEEGKNAETIVKDLDCPQFVGTTLVRQIKREARLAKEEAAKKPAAKGKK